MTTKLYYLNYCPYCRRLKAFLEKENIKFELVDVTDDPTEKRLIKEKTGHQTFPQLVKNGKFIGDCSSVIDNFKELKTQHKL